MRLNKSHNIPLKSAMQEIQIIPLSSEHLILI